MTAGKIILYAVLGTLMFYIWQEYDITQEVVERENHRYYKENKSAIEFTKKAMQGVNKKSVPIQKPMQKENTSQKIYAYISGKIDPSMDYKIAVLYHATSDDKSCQKRETGLFGGGIIPLSESFEYHPNVQGAYHDIKLPLRVFNPNKKCKLKPYLVRMYIFTRGNKREMHSLVLYTDNTHMYANQGFHKRWYTNNKIDMECIEPAPFPSAHYTPCGIKPLANHIAIMRRIPTKTIKLELNLNKLPLESLTNEQINHILRL